MRRTHNLEKRGRAWRALPAGRGRVGRRCVGLSNAMPHAILLAVANAMPHCGTNKPMLIMRYQCVSQSPVLSIPLNVPLTLSLPCCLYHLSP